MILRFITALLQIAGLVIFTVGAFSLALWLGFLVAGFLVFSIGYIFEKGVSDVPPSD